MHYPALVLNADYQPISVYPLKPVDMGRAFSKVVSGKADAVAFYDAEIRSANDVWVPPAVIALRRFAPRTERVAFTRVNVLARDMFSCQYCGCKLTLSELTFDHVIPSSRGGRTNFDNIVSACMPCNMAKADKSAMRPRRPPRTPRPWEMAGLRPVRASDIPAEWVYWLESAGVPLVHESVRDPNAVSQSVRDEIYWNGPLDH